jgi:hypothetical protein
MNKIINFSLVILIFGACSFLSSKSGAISNNSIGNTKKESASDNQVPKQVLSCDKCNIEYAKDVKLNIRNLNERQVELFLCSFDAKCSNNVEFSQFSNKVLFLLLSKHPLLTIKILAEGESYSMAEIQKALQNPVSDRIDINELYMQIEEIDEYQETREVILNSISIAMEKLN